LEQIQIKYILTCRKRPQIW